MNSTHRILMTVFQLSGDLFIKEPQLGLNNGRKKNHGEDNSRGRQARMSSLNITTKMKAILLHVAAVARSQALMPLDAPLLKLWRSRPLAYREGKHRKLAHCYMSLLREFHYEGQYIFDILIFVPFICLKNRTYLDNDFRKKGGLRAPPSKATALH